MALGNDWRANSVWLATMMTISCGSDTGQTGNNTTKPTTPITMGAAGTLPSTGAAGKVATVPPGSGAAGTPTAITPPPKAGTTAPPTAGIAGTLAAGGSAAAGTSAAAGGGAGSSATGGAHATAGGGTAGAAGGGTTDTTGGLIREDMPTEATAKAKGKFAVKSYTSGFPIMGYGAGTIYYPTDADPPFAMDTVVPGFTALQNSIAGWGPFLASHGIVTMTIDTLTTGDLPDQRADELMASLKALGGENTRDGSPLKGKLDLTRQCVSGWSMGGGGTLIAASKFAAQLKCGVSFAAWSPTGGASNKTPVLMFEGTTDPLAAGMSEGFYSQTPDTVPKMLFEVNGAGHDVANNPANSGGVIGVYGLSWFKVYLEGDERYKQFLLRGKQSINAKYMTNLK